MSDAYTPNADELLLIGTLTNVVGLRGMVRLNLVSTQPEHLAKSQPMLYSHDGKRSFRLRSLSHYKGALYTATLGGVATRDQAEALRNTDLYIIASAAAPLDNDEYFIHDLPGMTVVDEAGTVIGVVNDVITTGASDVIVIERPGLSEALVPMVKAFVRHLDVANRRLTIAPIPGLIAES
jgi:16S rRNA processing protein RimM